jgi:hypothetical protein
MGKFFLRFFLLLFVVIVSVTIFLSYFGLETDKFDSLIKGKVNEINRYVKLEFQKTKIHLNPTELNLIVKLQNPKIFVKNKEIILSKLDLFLSLRSFFTSDFLLRRAEVAFARNDIKDKNRSSFDKIISLFLTKIFGFCSLTIRFNSVGLRCILVF